MFTGFLDSETAQVQAVHHAFELIDGVAIPRNGSSTGHDGKELAEELVQKDPPPFPRLRNHPSKKKSKRPSGKCQKPYRST